MESLSDMFDRLARMRDRTLILLADVPPALRAVIPNGLRNHLHWQAGHIVTVQASLLYLRAGLTPFLDDSYFAAFAKGTAPADWTGQEPSYTDVLNQLTSSIPRLATDLVTYAETRYPAPITVSTGDTLTSFADALRFLAIHEGIHQGVIGTMVRILGARREAGRIIEQ